MNSPTSESSISHVSFLSATTAAVPGVYKKIAISSSTTTILSRVCLFLCLIPSLSLRPSALSLNRTVSFLLATLPPSLCTARVCSCLLVAPPSVAPRPFKTTTSLSTPFSPAVSFLFAGPRLVASCRSCRLFQGGLVTPQLLI
ncbi:hypothetical protein GQ42DRAFT_164153 [Ramicandelaber brevisporus]|nr:hypothetical protein GQ42DRAFT_164153 [Ramicandelaber brevisporus]